MGRFPQLNDHEHDTHGRVGPPGLVKMQTCHCLDFDALHQAVVLALLPLQERQATAQDPQQSQVHGLSQYPLA